ncbi:MAG: hypothetical protein ACR2JQ_00075 [Mycobacteriales bacterium]
MTAVISIALARRLRAVGLRWTPASGDRFVLPDLEMDDDVFVLSQLTVEVHHFRTGPVIGFNGTTEWALDSVEQDEALWLPSEGQLRERLGGTFRRLERDREAYAVVLEVAGHQVRIEHHDPVEAYGLALLHLITGAPVGDLTGAPPPPALRR